MVVDLSGLRGRRGTPLIRQDEASECALACLAMIANHHGYRTDLGVLRQRYAISLKGANVKQVMSVAESMGFSVRPLRGEINDLRHLSLPAILHWDMNHFVVLYRCGNGLRGERFHVHDPARGTLTLTRKETSRHFTGVALEVLKSERFRPRVERSSLALSQLWSSMTGFWQVARSIILLSVILQLTALAAPFFLQIAVDTVIPASDRDLLLMLAIGFGGLAFVSMAAGWLRSIVLLNLNNGLSYQIVVNLFRHLMRLPLAWFEKRHVGDVISRFGSTLPITQLLSEGMVAALLDGIMALLTLALMFAYSPLLAGVGIVVLILHAGLRVAFLQVLRIRNVDAISTAARENSIFIESVRGIAAIKAFGQEANRQRIWQRAKADAVNANIKLGRLSAGFDSGGQAIMAVERVLFVFLATSLVLDAKMTIGMVFALQAYKQQFLDAGQRLIEQAMNLSAVKVHLARLSDIALSKSEEDGHPPLIDKPDFGGGLEMQGVRFRYGAGEPEVLRGVDLRIEAGEMISIVGPSGGGKTTLLKILMGLVEPTAGAVLISGRRLNTLSRQAFRACLGVVAQDDVMYAGSLAENIAFFDPDIDMSRVIEVARLAAIDDEIMQMPMRYDTLVGDMGSTLSGGQKQRILLARALYPYPKVLFMDEGTANLDPASESQIIAALTSLDLTRVMVAHRPGLVQASDRVFFCGDGSLHLVDYNGPTM